MTKLRTVLMSFLLAAVPLTAQAEVSLVDMLDLDTSLSSDVIESNSSADITQPGPGRGPAPRPGYAPPPPPRGHVVVRRGYAPPPPRRVYTRTVVHTQPVVVVDQPSTVVVDNSSNETTTEKFVGSRFGFGLRGVGLLQSAEKFSAGSELKNNIAGGIGYYFKLRPIRWVSVEFINDIQFGCFEDLPADSPYKNYIRVPVSLGLRAHVFDYGSLDVYGVAAASVSFTTVDDGNDFIDQELRYYQFGGQFGAGVSLVAGIFEIGIDLRYTIEEAPDKYRFADPSIDSNLKDDPIHGFLFSLNVGFAL